MNKVFRMITLALLLLFTPALCFSQAPDTLWTRTYGGVNTDRGVSVHQTADNGYIILGNSMSYGAGAFDIYLIKTDSLGNIEWTNTYGGPVDDWGHCVQQAYDGGYIVTGYTYSYGLGLSDLYLIKINSIGDTTWTKTYGTDRYDAGVSIKQESDSSYIVTGYKGTSVYEDVWLLKFDSQGDTIWTKVYDQGYSDWGSDVMPSSDSGYIITGAADGPMRDDVLAIRTDIDGDTVWTKKYGGMYHDFGTCLCQANDSDYIIAGGTWSYGAGYDDVYILKLNAAGDTIWTRTHGDSISDYGCSIQSTVNGFVITGLTMPDSISNADVLILNCNSQGQTQWIRQYGGNNNEQGNSIDLTSDGGYIVVGQTASFGAGDDDIWLLKLGPDTLGINTIQTQASAPKIYYPTVLNKSLIVLQNCKYKIYDITGRQIHDLNPAPGIYFLIINEEIKQKIVQIK